MYNSNIERIEIPETVELIGSGAFIGCRKLSEMIVWSITPPQASDLFDYTEVNEELKIYVPSESLDLYKSSDGWSELSNYIFPIE